MENLYSSVDGILALLGCIPKPGFFYGGFVNKVLIRANASELESTYLMLSQRYDKLL